MEQVISVQQAQTNFLSIIEQVQNFGSSFIISEQGKPSIKIEVADKTVTKDKPKRNAGFLKNTNNTTAPKNFDRMNEDEIFKLFSGE